MEKNGASQSTISKPINLATVFSGIGAIEQAFEKMSLPYRLVFACDNGERELVPLTAHEAKEFRELKKNKVCDNVEADRLKYIESIVNRRVATRMARGLRIRDGERRKRYADSLYDRYAQGKPNLVYKTYMANYCVAENDFHPDIRCMDGREYTGRVDMMVGGSPCQSFSSNGKRAGIEDTRGTLFYEYARLIRDIRPKCFIFENVKGLLVHDSGKTWKIIRNVFSSLDYDIHINYDKNGVESPCLNAVDYGIPQTRERIFLVGIKKGLELKSDFVFPKPVKLEKSVADFLDPIVDSRYYLGKKGFEFVTTHPTRAQVGCPIMNCQKANQQFNWNGDFIFEPLSGKHNEAILSKAYVGTWNGQIGVIRKFTPRECLRLMGYPDTFKIVVNDTTMYRQAGNSIVVNVLEHIVRQLLRTGIFDD